MPLHEFLRRFLFIPFMLLVVISAAPVISTAGAPAAKMAFLPLALHAGEDISYLQDGVRAMLASRLAADAGLEIIDQGKVSQAAGSRQQFSRDEIAALAGQLAADYLVSGSITGLGQGVSFDIQVYSTAAARSDSFYANASQRDDIIAAIDQLAVNCLEKLFGRQRPAAPSPMPAAGETASVAPLQGSGYQTAHPDRLVPRGALPQSGKVFSENQSQWSAKSPNFKLALQSAAAGDLDGDGAAEFVVAGRNEVLVYRNMDGHLQPAGKIATLPNHKIHAVSLADFNGNGRAEIYISAADGKGPHSSVVEWQGNEFATLTADVLWYLRTLEIPGEGVVLAGQQGGLSGPMRPGIHRLVFTENQVRESGLIDLPKAVNLFDFTLADIDSDGRNEMLAIDRYDRLRIYRANGEVMWKGDEYFNGTSRFIGEERSMDIHFQEDNLMEKDADSHDRLYLPSRILFADLNGDGIRDVIVNNNLPSSSRFFENMKSYPAGMIQALNWNGISMTPVWQTRKIDGQVNDYFLVPAAGDGPTVFAVGIILDSGDFTLSSKKQSTLLFFELNK